ncbi:MAG: BON domain-containing protein [Pirellulaceae bacterium]
MRLRDTFRFSTNSCLLLFGLALIAPAGYGQGLAMTDQDIADKIDDELLLDPGVNSMLLDIQVDQGVVTLTGRAASLLAKERAARIATTVKGVRSVINQVEVRPSQQRSDKELSRDIEAALLADPAADAYEIAVSVQDGVASLTGTVQSYRERDLSLTVAKGVRGVTGVVDQLVVRYQGERPDIEIQQEIDAALHNSVFVDDNMIEVTVQDGEVSLSGTVGSAAEKQMVNTISWVAGVRSVDSGSLTVARWARDDQLRGNKYAGSDQRSIEQAIRTALEHDPRVRADDIEVAVAGGHVTLRGKVNSLAARQSAEQDARYTVGVFDVTNRLKVRPEEDLSDADIRRNVRQSLERDVYLEPFEIATLVVDGVVHLYGTVDTRFERRRAHNLVGRVKGVVGLRDYLTTSREGNYLYNAYIDTGYIDEQDVAGYEQRSPSMTDAQLKTAIESEMWWSPFVDSDDVAVTVENGVARLSGTVESWSERQSATENAYEGGATLVDNDLRISSLDD